MFPTGDSCLRWKALDMLNHRGTSLLGDHQDLLHVKVRSIKQGVGREAGLCEKVVLALVFW